MEYRLWITIPDLPLDDEDRWEPLARCLELEFSDFGPVFTWTEDHLVAIIALDAGSEAEAALLGVGIIADALQRVGLSDRYPIALDVEEADTTDAELTPA